MNAHPMLLIRCGCLALAAFSLSLASPGLAAGFTRLIPLPAPAITAHSKEYPGDGFRAAHLIDDQERTEFSSDGAGTNTFVEFDFGAPVVLAGFKHVDRADPATLAASRLTFFDTDGRVTGSVDAAHPDQRSGVTWIAFTNTVTARRARWQATRLGTNHHGTVGGAEMVFYTAGAPQPAPEGVVLDVRACPVLERSGAAALQPVRVRIVYPCAEPVEAVLRVEGLPAQTLQLSLGTREIEMRGPPAMTPRTLQSVLESGGRPLAKVETAVKPPRDWQIYILAHSHVDIGYTETQADVEEKQIRNIARGLEMAKATASNPEGSRYKWNVEVLWAVESYLRRQTPEKQREFYEAVRKGQIGLDALYGNELTALCRPEELLRLFRYATRLGAQCGVPVEAAMISDVPGYTWGVVSAMAEAGVKYWSIGPNYIDRIGSTLVHWENKPFYWVGPSGQDKVLCWVPYQGYANSHKTPPAQKTRFVLDLVEGLETADYPYDLIHLRWSGYGDNAVPDELIPEFVRDWNEKYISPRLILSTTAEAFRAFEQRYGARIPRVSGDWTPYWEDGAASSARETALNRAAAERLVQAETLFAMLSPAAYSPGDFDRAWREVILYDEHTWGAHNSVSQPDLPFVKEQWRVKQSFALNAASQSSNLLEKALAQHAGEPVKGTLDVFNTLSWPRTELVTIPREKSAAGDRVLGARGGPVASQRLKNGDLAFLAADVPAFASERFILAAGPGGTAGGVKAEATRLTGPNLSLELDPKTGVITSLRWGGRELAAASNGLNRYLYLPGSALAGVLPAANAQITVKEPGPLVASLLVELDAPGCRSLTTEIRLVDGLDRVEILNTLDKKAVREKEGVHFGFGFNIPGGVMRVDIPFAVMRPEQDQIPGACKNWLTVSRWLDLANAEGGVTWAALDAPLIEVGTLTGNLLGSQTDPKAWIEHLAPSQSFYSWVMNNHWHTNYRAEQEGLAVFRYYLRPHRGYSAVDAARFGIASSQPLLAAPAAGKTLRKPRLSVEGLGTLVTSFKPSDDGKAWIVRLFGAGGKAERVKLAWADPKPAAVFQSDLSEKQGPPQYGPVEVPAWGLVTLRAERP